MGTGDASLLWVLSRERTLSDRDYMDALSVLRTKAIDSSRLTRVPQPPE